MMALRTLFGGGWRRTVGIALVAGAIGAAAAPGVRLWQETTAHDWRLLGLGTLARAKLAAGADAHALQRYEWISGEVAPMPLRTVAADPKIDWTRNRILDLAGEAGWRGLGAGCAAALAALALLAGWRHHIYGGGTETPPVPVGHGARTGKRRPARRSGTVSGRIAAAARAAMPRRAVRIAGIRYPKEAGRGHTLVAGAAGSGRRALIADLVTGVRARGGRCIVHDPSGEYTRRLFDPARDALLNPLDARAAAWSPLRDARGRGDFEAMAAALVPDAADAGGAVLAARQLFVEVAEALRRRGVADGGTLLDLLLEAGPGALARALDGTAAGPALARTGPAFLPGARVLLRRHLAALRFAPGGGFSIRGWVERGDGLLLLALPDDPNGRLRGLVSAWMETALGAAMSLDPGGGGGLWMVVDDLPALHRLPSLLPALGEARGLGVRFALGVEALGPLRGRYGADGAGTVAGLCATRAVLAAADEETAVWCSAAIGDETLAPAWRLRRLAPGEGVVRFPGRHDAVAFSLKDLRASGAAARFVPVDGARMFLDEAPAPPVPARKPPSQTGGPAKRRSKEARPPASAETAGAGDEDGERPEARPARKRRRAGRWI